MIKLILRGGPYTAEEHRQIIDYCWLDTDGLAALLPRILPDILARPHGWAFALIRGYYSGHCIAHMEHTGVPLDMETYERLDRHWDAIRARLVAQYDPEFGVYDGLRFVTERFADYLVREDIPWPEHRSGALDLRDKTFAEWARSTRRSTACGSCGRPWPSCGSIRSCSARTGATVPCSDSSWLRPAQRTRGGQFIFGPSRWLRGADQADPRPGARLPRLDRQEFVIAAALSGDQHMLAAIASDDAYMWFARMARLVPIGPLARPTRRSAKSASAAVSGVLYGMGDRALAMRIKRSELEARELLEHHRRIFPTFWAWSGRAVHEATLFGYIDLAFGWRVHDGTSTAVRTPVRQL